MERRAADMRRHEGANDEEDPGEPRALAVVAGVAGAPPDANENDEKPRVMRSWFEDHDFDDAFSADEEVLHDSLEVSYLGTTRVVVAHGLQVRELLFGDEFTSLRFIHWEKGNASRLRYIVERIAYRMGLPGPVVEHAEEMSPRVKIIHFVNKSVAAAIYGRLLRGKKNKTLGIEPVRAANLAQPDEITTASLTGRLNMTWADGIATGGAIVEFSSAAAANAFLRTHPIGLKTKPLGITPDEYVADEDEDEGKAERVLRMAEMRLSLMEIDPWRPPLRFVEPRGTYNRQAYFDEAAINAMAADQTILFKYAVRICSGLAKNEDEVRLRELLFPHRFTKCTIERISTINPYDNQERTIARVLNFQRVFDDCYLTKDDVITAWADKIAVRAGVFLSFSDLDRMNMVYEAAMASWNWSSMERPYCQPVRMYVEYIYRMDVKEDVYKFFRGKIDAIGRDAQSSGARYIVKSRDGPKELLFRSRNLATVQRIATAMEDIFQCEKLPSAITSVLLSQAGYQTVQTWTKNLSESEMCVRVDEVCKAIWVYGGKTSREQSIERLREWAKRIQASVEVLDHVVRVDVARIEADMANSASASATESLVGRECVVQWLGDHPGRQQLFHSDVLGDGSRIVISGSTLAVKDLLDKWSSEGYLLKRDGILHSNGDEHLVECGVCMLPVDEPRIKFALCGHVFCHECIRPGVNAGSNLPLTCPVENCGSLVHVTDVAKIIVDLSAIAETALFGFVAAHPTECVVCPKSGCNQILPRRPNAENHFVFCESCASNYCLECSKTLARAMEGHELLSCEEFRSLCSEGRADIHVRFIRDHILTLCCPSCKAAFLDFDGCTAVFCGNVTCRQYFCANCLEFSSKISDATHKHVLACPKNPCQGNYFVSDIALALTHRAHRTAKMHKYLSTRIPNRDVRRIVLMRLTKDLEDLKITMPIDFFPGSNEGQAKRPTAPAPPAA